MFNTGDLVRVLYASVGNLSVVNKASHKNYLAMGGRTPIKVVGTNDMDLIVSYGDKVKVDKIGKVTHSFRGAVYTVDINGQSYYCFPDELELAYTL